MDSGKHLLMFKNLIGLILLFVVQSGIAQNYSFNWDKTYGGISRDWNCTIVTSTSGDVFLIGDSQTDVNGDKTVPLCSLQLSHSDLWLIKTDTAGTILWQKDFGAESDERLPQLTLLNNPAKEMIFSCHSSSNTGCDKTEPNRDTIPLLSTDYWIAKLDSNGVIIWEKTLGGDNFDDNTKIIMLSTGEILVCGESNSPVGYDKTVPNYSISNDFWALKLDANGNIISDFVYGGTDGEFLAAAIPDNQGGFLLAGSSNSNVSGDISQASQGNLDYWMIKVDNQGNKVWDKRFGGTGPDRCNYAAATADDGFILCGYTVSPQGGDVSQPPKGLQDYWVVKTDASGNLQFDRRFGGNGSSFGTWVNQDNDGGYWLAGYSNSSNVIDVTEPSYGGSDFWVLKIDSTGTKTFDRRFGGFGDEFNPSMAALNDSVYLVFGQSDSGSSSVKLSQSRGWLDYWLVNFTWADGTSGINPYPSENMFSVYPNPSNGTFTLEMTAEISGPYQFILTDLAGKIVYNERIFFDGKQKYHTFNLTQIRNGFYFLEIKNQYQTYHTSEILINHLKN